MKSSVVHPTRRAVFTFVAVAAFLLLAQQTYMAGVDRSFGAGVDLPAGFRFVPRWVLPLAVALVPAVLLSAASHNVPFQWRDPSLWVALGLMVACVAWLYHVGKDDGLAARLADETNPRQRLRVSWGSVGTPALVVVAYVVFDWRRRRSATPHPVGQV